MATASSGTVPICTTPRRYAQLLADVRPSHLLHAAWYVEPADYLRSLENLRWVASTLHLVEAFRAGGGERIVGVGTSAEYGPRDGAVPGGHHAAGAGHALCGVQERACTTMLTAWSAQAGVAFAWGRVFNLHGPHEAPGPAGAAADTRRRRPDAVCDALPGAAP